MENGTKLKLLGGLLVFVGLFVLIFCTTKVNPGYGGVVYSANGGVQDPALSQGWKLIAPWQKVTDYPVSTETVYHSKDEKEGSKDDESFDISTKDGKNVNVDVSYSYRMDFDKLPSIYTKFRGRGVDEIENGYMRDRLKESCNVVSTKMGVQEVYGEKRQELNDEVERIFREKLAEVGIILENFSFPRIEPDSNSMKAIQAKVDAKQALDRMKIEKDQAQVQADKRVVEAQGRADAKIIEATAEKEANELLEKSLTDAILRDKWITTWDGVMPKVTGGDSGVLVQLD